MASVVFACTVLQFVAPPLGIPEDSMARTVLHLPPPGVVAFGVLAVSGVQGSVLWTRWVRV